MSHFSQFVVEHWELWLAFVIILGYLIVTELQDKMNGSKSVSAQELINLVSRQHGVVLDIRDQPSFQQGHILDALSYPASELKDKIDQLKKYKDKPVVVVCFKGQSAINITDELLKHGFSQAVCLKGGMAEWQAQGLPIHKE